jgi:hypothetical protein
LHDISQAEKKKCDEFISVPVDERRRGTPIAAKVSAMTSAAVLSGISDLLELAGYSSNNALRRLYRKLTNH